MSDPEIPTMAPNMKSEVQRTMNEHPEIDTMKEPDRAEIIDITAWRINGNVDRPWGRKARQNNPNNPNLNTDAMTYLRPDNLFEIYDVISGVDGSATWDNHGVVVPGENGYWWPPQGTPDSGPEPVPPDTQKDDEQDARLVALESAVSTLSSQVDELVQLAKQPFRAHGPVDLPIVVESLTRMRAKGDIDVDVESGAATPPPVSDESFDLLDLAVLKRILGREKK